MSADDSHGGGPPARDTPATAARLRIAASSEPERQGTELSLDEGPLIVGRADDCDLTLEDGSVSRKHVRVEPHDDGLRVVDLGSSNGTWIGDERVAERVLGAGDRFRVGSTVLECVVPAPPQEDTGYKGSETVILDPDATLVAEHPAPAEEAPPAEGFWLDFSDTGDDGLRGREIGVDGDEAVLGRGDTCSVVVDDAHVSRQHARIERRGGRFRVVDLGSTNGVWVDGHRVEEPVEVGPGDEVIIGKTTRVSCWLEPRERRQAAEQPVRPQEAEPAATREAGPGAPAAPDEPAVSEKPAPPEKPEAPRGPAAAGPATTADLEDVSTGQTVVIQTTAAQVARTKRIEGEGEEILPKASRPFLIDDPDSVWYVVEGGVDIFMVSLEDGKPAGTRSHFLGVLEGQCMFGFDLTAQSSGFLAVVEPGTRLRRIPVGRLQELAAGPAADPVAQLVETWVAGLSRSLVRDVPAPDEFDAMLEPGESVSLDPSERAQGGAGSGVVWFDLWSGSALFIDMAVPAFPGKRTRFPVTEDTWIQPVGDEFGELVIDARATRDMIAEPPLWTGLQVFHEVLCECEFINKKLAAVDEFIRLQDKAHHVEAAKEAAYDAIGSVLSPEAAKPREFLGKGSVEPVLQACKIVGDAAGIEVRKHPGADESLTYEEKINAIASASGFRTRVVALKGDWWEGDHGPLLGQRQESQQPVAILPTSATSYEYVDPDMGEPEPVDEDVATTLSGFAYSFYRPFPEGDITVRDLVKTGAQGLKRDFLTLVGMALTIGFLGTATPYFTGEVFDSAIPDSNTGLLLGFGIAILGAGIGTFAFKITQSVATLRVQGKMEGTIQAALWDRLLDLPASFFGEYSSGDLADRAMGIDQIQTLVSGAGVAAILGSISGLFYVGMMLMYSWLLAAVAVVLTAIYVGVTWTCNYLQLRHQRDQMRLQGEIGGLVLNLITGVTRLRTSGAEHHAFREWAQRFSAKRKIGFTVGQIQNFATVFNDIFPLLSSIVIFGTMLNAQSGPEATALLTTGQFIAFNSAFGLFQKAMQALGEASLNMLRIVPVYERLQPILTTEPEIDTSKAYPGELRGGIELANVSFRYIDDMPWVIKDLSLKIDPGEMVAFVGGSGCGKSTLMRLMLGFETPQSGGVYYDGQDLETVDKRMLRQQLGVVLQQSQVLPTEIYRNIVGASSRSIEEAWEAAEAAGLAEDIRAMPMEMHTYVSEGGGTLSGGQRQRLMIARAIVNKPSIMFLDEATSALDNKAQAVVTESMDALDATRIVIAHRLSTIIGADKICYLEGGGIAEMGTYDELMAVDGKFAQLARRQME